MKPDFYRKVYKVYMDTAALSSREKVRNIINRRAGTPEGAFWTGHPNDRTIPIYADEWGIEETREAIYTHLHDDCRWVMVNGYKHPDGLQPIDPEYGVHRVSLGAGGCFAGAETIGDIEKYPWPDVKYCDFSDAYAQIEQYSEKMVFTGIWSPFFHNIADFFGMENYFIKMYESPKLIEAVTEMIVDYYVAANDLFFSKLGGRADIMFFGNDFGTQRDLFISVEHFKRFVLPSMKRLIAVGKKHNVKVMLHSCGSIYRVIPDLIDAGVDMLHPIQAQAAGMSAKELARYKNDLIFLGGIDAQSFLVDSTPRQISEEVERVRDILGPGIIISPSHEEILPNVPAANMAAMSEAARAAPGRGVRASPV
jgi:uroporphyrinogen decarboxylase